MKSNLDKLFKTNEDLEKNGVEFAIDDKTSFKIRHFTGNNPRVAAAMAKYHKPFARQIELGTLDPKKGTEISIKLFIDVCLVSWQGVEIDGKEVECTKENALQLFLSLPALFETLWKYANDFQSYREDVGNS